MPEKPGSPSFACGPRCKIERGCECPWGQNQGGGVGRRPTPGDICPQGHSHPRPPVCRRSAFPSARMSRVRFAYPGYVGIGRESCREGVGKDGEDSGGAGELKKKKET